MKIVIAGIGKFGDYLTRQLAKENNEITVIDIIKKYEGGKSDVGIFR